MTIDPQLGYVNAGYQAYSPIVGIEYQGGIAPPFFSLENNNYASLLDLSPPCAVCHSSTRSAQMMFPAMMTCPTGWNFEYEGYLVSENKNNRRSSFICLDSAPQAIANSQGNQMGGHICAVEVQCGVSLPCPPYINGNEVPCVVCTM